MKNSLKLLKHLNFLVALSPFVFPLYLFRFDLMGIPFTGLEFFCYLLFSLFLLAVLKGQLKISWAKPARWYYYLTFLLFIGATLGVVTAPHYIALPSGVLMDAQQTALGVWKGWVVAPMLYFFVFTQVIRSSDGLKELIRNFVYSGALVALASYGYGMFSSGITYDLRLSGFFESANYLSLYIVPALLMSIYYVLNGNMLGGRHEFYNLMAITIMTHALFMTQSYAAVIGVFGSLVLYILVILFKHRMHLKKMFGALTLIFLVLVVVVGSQYNSQKFQQFIDFENRSSSSVRLEIYEVAYDLVRDYPLTGVGPGLFQGFYQIKGPGYLEKAPMEWNIPHPHNIFFAFWLNAGLLGLIALLGFIVLAHTRLTYPLLALWGILIHGLFDTPFWKNDLAMIFWLVLGAILILQTYGSTSVKKSESPIRKRALIHRSASARTRKLRA